jgi:GNAT superfamily N-acetyltransferase
MSDPVDQFRADRDNRHAARGVFDAGVVQVKDDLAARGIGGRIADKAGDEAKAALDEAIEVAKDSKGIIAGTVAALALWTFRAPLLSAAQGLWGRLAPASVQEDNDSTGEYGQEEQDQ